VVAFGANLTQSTPLTVNAFFPRQYLQAHSALGRCDVVCFLRAPIGLHIVGPMLCVPLIWVPTNHRPLTRVT